MSKIRKKDLLKINFLSSVQISPSKEYISVVKNSINEEKDSYENRIYLFKIAEKNWYQLTDFGKEANYFWDEKIDKLYILTDRENNDEQKKADGLEKTIIYELIPGEGEAKKKYTIPKNISKIKQIHEENFLFISKSTSGEKDFFQLKKEETEKIIENRKSEEGWHILEAIPYWLNGSGFIDGKVNRLFFYDGKKDKITVISDKLKSGIQIQDFELNVKKNLVSIIYSKIGPKNEKTNGFLVYNLVSEKVIYDYDKEDIGFSKVFLTSNRKIMALGSKMEQFGINENDQLMIFNLDSFEPEKVLDFDMTFYNSVGSDIRYNTDSGIQLIDDKLFFNGTLGYSAGLYSVDLAGNFKTEIDINGSVDEFICLENEFYFIGLYQMMPQEIYVQNQNNINKISNFNDVFSNKRSLIYPEKFTVIDKDGFEIDAWLMKPSKLKKLKKYPLILDIHGGPKTVYGEVYYHEMQYWAAEGFVVLFCNPRGSDGKGNAFADIRGKYGDVDFLNIMQVLDFALKQNDFIDENNLFVTGGSYGGFMTNWIIGHTNRFKAAATQRSISNWISMFGTTDIGYYFADDQTATNPWLDVDKMWEQSPMKYYNQVKTPTLIIHSQEDYRCWLVEGLQLFTSLKFHGVDSKMLIFKNENHELTRSGKPKNRIKSMTEIFEWFKKYYI